MKPGNSTNPLRVSMIVSGFPVLSQTFVSLQLAALVRRGHQIDVYNLGRRGRWDWLPTGVGDSIGNVRIHHRGSRLRKRRINYFLFPKMIYLLSMSPLAAWSVLKEVLSKSGYKKFSILIADAYLMKDLSNYDLIHCQFANIVPRILELRALGLVGDKPELVCSVRGHDITKEKYQGREFWNAAFAGVDRFLPVCRKLESALIDKGCNKQISIVRSPVNVDHIQSIHGQRPSGKQLRLVSIGRLVEKKGIIDALGALLILKHKGVEFQYSIIGDGALRRSLTDYAAAHGLTDHVQFLGAMPPDETLGILASSDVLIAPSKRAEDGNCEGIPNALKEAMLLEVQVIATTHSGIPELINHEENGYLCAESDPEDLARVIQRVADHPEQWEATAERAVVTVRSEYSPEKTTDDLIGAYRATIA
jgi:colanic acid/amylovoran biosynthesis glycosyltransferase